VFVFLTNIEEVLVCYTRPDGSSVAVQTSFEGCRKRLSRFELKHS